MYLGVTFRFKEGRKSQVFIVWYIAAAAEAILNLLLSNFSPVLSLGSSHLMKRMALLTVMIVGEGIESMAKKVIIIVNNPGAWGESKNEIKQGACNVSMLIHIDRK